MVSWVKRTKGKEMTDEEILESLQNIHQQWGDWRIELDYLIEHFENEVEHG